MSTGSRHLSTPALYEHWRSGVPVVIPLPGEPELRLRIDSPSTRLTLRAPVASGVTLPRNELAHVRLDLVVHDGHRFVEISTTDERLIVDGYAMLSAIADRIQVDHVEPLKALAETLATWRSILARRARMTPEAEIGLFGELIVVEALLDTGDISVSAWRGGLREEHDFGMSDVDFEVKTTSGERRQHWIHGLRQLVPTGTMPLWLVSLQITRGGAGQGRTLPELIQVVLSAAPDEAARLHAKRVLEAAGWTDDQADLFPDSWRARTTALALPVDGTFPSITPAHLVKASVDVGAIRQVSYEIDVTERTTASEPPPSLATILSHMESPGE